MRKLFSKFAFSVAFGLALAFTFSCSSDDGGSSSSNGSGGGTAACKSITEFNEPINGKKTGGFCEEASEKRVKALTDKYNSKHNEKISISEFKESQWKKECEDPEYAEKGKYYDSCPAGYVLKCRDDDELYTTYYLYGDEFKGVNCDEFSEKWGFVYGGDDVSSSSVKSGSGSSSSSGGGGNNKCTDIANCKKKQIGNQVWMLENLNIDVKGSKCYGEGVEVLDFDDGVKTLSDAEVQANCSKYGRLYNWETANTVCPSGWHLPTIDDWNELIGYIDSDNECSPCDEWSKNNYGGCSSCAGKYLKATSEWPVSNYNGVEYNLNGVDKYGFFAQPGGYLQPIYDGFSVVGHQGVMVGNMGYWWSSSHSGGNSDSIYGPKISSGDGFSYSYKENVDEWRSVRCVKDE